MIRTLGWEDDKYEFHSHKCALTLLEILYDTNVPTLLALCCQQDLLKSRPRKLFKCVAKSYICVNRANTYHSRELSLSWMSCLSTQIRSQITPLMMMMISVINCRFTNFVVLWTHSGWELIWGVCFGRWSFSGWTSATSEETRVLQIYIFYLFTFPDKGWQTGVSNLSDTCQHRSTLPNKTRAVPLKINCI